MLHNNVIENKSGFRTLDDAELEAVSGGNRIIVTGTPPKKPLFDEDSQFFLIMDLQREAALQSAIDLLNDQPEMQQVTDLGSGCIKLVA